MKKQSDKNEREQKHEKGYDLEQAVDDEQKKAKALEPFTVEDKDEHLTTNQGVRMADTEHSLKAGPRGPTLLEDFHFREKITHFDHEIIPERVVHARGSGAHGFFECTQSMAEYTMASFLSEPGKKTPVFVRFSQVAGSRGSKDTARDVRGFATKFYTDEGNFDLVGNNMPVFFIHDAIKFPDLIHAAKPEPNSHMPQAATAHDTFWDFISMSPESAHMVMWAMSDRGISRSYRMMEGFGVNTFRFVNAEGRSHFVKFHWKPVLGMHSLVWDEAVKLGGVDPDFLRRDLFDAINAGSPAEYHFGVQLISEEDEFAFDFDILDPTKIWPEEEVPIKICGKMTLNRNPDNFFAETEQVAFHPGHVVRGIDFSNDPLLQGRLFSYLDTQISRLGGPNFHEIPINKPLAPVHNNQRDAMHRQTINRGRTSYHPNTLNGGFPKPAPREHGGYVSYSQTIEGLKVRATAESFLDYYNQARLFLNSQSEHERRHLIKALQFELGKVVDKAVRERVVEMLNRIEHNMAKDVAAAIGVAPPPAGEESDCQKVSPALSMNNTVKQSIKTRKIAIIVGNGYDSKQLTAMKDELAKYGAVPEIVSKVLGEVRGKDDGTATVQQNYETASPVIYDAVFIPGGKDSVESLRAQCKVKAFIMDMFMHCKAIAATGEAVALLKEWLPGLPGDREARLCSEVGVVTCVSPKDMGSVIEEFGLAIAKHRAWDREALLDKVPPQADKP